MSPEQAEGRAAGPEADVYSLALTLYECWSGENPHRRSTPAATARAIGARARPLRRLRPDLPRELTDDDRRLPAAAPQPPALAGGAGRRDRGLARPARRAARPRQPARSPRGSPRSPLAAVARRLARRRSRRRSAVGSQPVPRPGDRSHLQKESPISVSTQPRESRSKASSRGSSAAPSAPRCSRSNSPANWPRKWTRTRPPSVAARLRPQRVHGLPLEAGPRQARGLRALARAGALRLPARARAPARLRPADPARGRVRDRRAPAPRRVRDPGPPGQAARPTRARRPSRAKRATRWSTRRCASATAAAPKRPEQRGRRPGLDPRRRLARRPPLRARRPAGDDRPLEVGRVRALATPTSPAATPSCAARESGDWQIVDLGSTNGIKVNGRRVASTRLSPGRPGRRSAPRPSCFDIEQ